MPKPTCVRLITTTVARSKLTAIGENLRRDVADDRRLAVADTRY